MIPPAYTAEESHILTMKHTQHAFTLIELLIVVLIIGVLSGVTLSIINIQGTKEKTKDGVRSSNIQKLAEGIEAYKVVEKVYPDAGGSNNPLTGADASKLSTYVSSWPADEEDSYLYFKISNSEFVVGVAKSDNKFYKYHSGWNIVKECDSLQANITCNN